MECLSLSTIVGLAVIVKYIIRYQVRENAEKHARKMDKALPPDWKEPFTHEYLESLRKREEEE